MAFSTFRPQASFNPQGIGSTSAPSFLQPQPQQQQQQHQQNMMMMGSAGQNQQQQQQQQEQIHLFTTEKTPVTYQTKWADIHPDSQKLLLQIEERILEYRNESERLDQCVRLYDTSALNEGFELDAARILQEIGVNSTAIDREKVLLQELMNTAKSMLRNAEVAVRSFMILRPRFIRPAVSSGAPTSTPPSSGVNNLPNSAASQLPTSSMMDFYSGLPTKPSPFLQQTVARFERQLGECRQWIEELERLLLSESDENGGSNSDLRLLQSLPSVISNVHDFFIYVAAQVETFHQRIGSMRAAYLADQRRRGDENDPFLEADRRELAKREAAAKRVHPALHASTFSQNSTQVAGLFTSSAAPASSLSGMSHSTQSTPGTFTAASSGAGFSMFSAPASSSSSSSFLFSTQAASAPSSIFGSSGALQTPSMFGTSQTTPSMFGANTSSSLFPSATATASSSSLFSSSAFGTGSTSSSGLFGASTVASTSLFGASSSPSTGLFGGGQTSGGLFNANLSFGAGTTSGSSFGAATKTSKPKPRTTRR